MAPVVNLRWEDGNEEHKEKLYDVQPDGSGRLDWAAVEKAFGADLVEIEDEGTPSLLKDGNWKGYTIDTFKSGSIILVTVSRKAQGENPETSLIAKVHELALDVRTLQEEREWDSQTSRTDADVGKVVYQTVSHVSSLGCFVELPGGEKKVEAACAAVIAQFPAARQSGARYLLRRGSATGGQRRRLERTLDEGNEGASDQQLSALSHSNGDQQQQFAAGAETEQAEAAGSMPGYSLADFCPSGIALEEVKHMQPVAMKVVTAIAQAVKCDAYIVDTHSASCRLSNPLQQPDMTALAAPGDPCWAQVVHTSEFMLTDADRMTAYGQQVKRTCYTLDAQDPRREHAMSIILTMNSVEFLLAERGYGKHFRYSTTGQMPFSISPASQGMVELVRALSTPKDRLGFLSPRLPDLRQHLGLEVTGLQLLRRGKAAGSGSFVFQGSLGDETVVVKLNRDQREVQLLDDVKDVPHVIQLAASGTCMYLNVEWNVAVIKPYVHLLTPSDTLQVVGQVVHDVATAVEGIAMKGVAHRDVTEGNIGRTMEGRGILMDFSAGKRIEGYDWAEPRLAPDSPMSADVWRIIGTLLYAPLSVLRGEPHTVSSQLEGLFLSVLNLSCNGNTHTRGIRPHELEIWEALRSGALTRLQLMESNRIVSHMKPLVHALHDLFYPWEAGAKCRRYRQDVSPSEVRAICQRVCNNKLLP